jgi:hypothetical protein
MRTTYPAEINFLDFIIHALFGGKFMLQEYSLGNCILLSTVICAILGPNILLNILKRLSFRNFSLICKTKFHSHTTTNNVIV